MANDPQTEALRRQRISETKRQKSGRSLTDERPQPCACGCGELTTVAGNTGKARKWVAGHQHRRQPDQAGYLFCRDCEQWLPPDRFYRKHTTFTGVRAICILCSRRNALAWNAANPDRVLDAHLRRTFGITLQRYNELAAEQNGVCAICGDAPTWENSGRWTKRNNVAVIPRLVVDHDHVTGNVRGLLCGRCNTGIGFLRDDPVIVRFALKYLEERGE